MYRKKSTKIILSTILTLSLLLTVFSFSVFAKSGKIDGFSREVTLEDTFPLGQSSSIFYSGQNTDTHGGLMVQPGDEIRIPLTADMFTWSDDRTPLPRQAVQLRDLKRGKVTVRTQRQSGASVLDYVQLETDMFAGKPFFAPNSTAKTGRTAYISVMFAEEVVSVKDIEFEFAIYVAIDGQTDDSMRIDIRGTMVHNTMEVNANTDYVNASDGTVIEATEVARGVTVNAGNGVTIDRLMLRNKKYYATSSVKSASDAGFEQDYPEVYPSVIAAYKMNTVNMRYGKSIVRIDTNDDKNYYVYNEKMKFIGMSKDELHYSDYYFLSTIEIPTFEKDNYVAELSRGPSYNRGYESGELSEQEYLQAEGSATKETETQAAMKSITQSAPKMMQSISIEDVQA